MQPLKSDVLARCDCGGIMSIAVVEQRRDHRQHTFICEQCAEVGKFTFPSPPTAPR